MEANQPLAHRIVQHNDVTTWALSDNLLAVRCALLWHHNSGLDSHWSYANRRNNALHHLPVA